MQKGGQKKADKGKKADSQKGGQKKGGHSKSWTEKRRTGKKSGQKIQQKKPLTIKMFFFVPY